MGRWIIKLGGQNGRLLHWPKCCCVSTKTKLWKSLLRPDIYFPSLVCPLAHHNFPFLATAHDCKLLVYLLLTMSIHGEECRAVRLHICVHSQYLNVLSYSHLMKKLQRLLLDRRQSPLITKTPVRAGTPQRRCVLLLQYFGCYISVILP